MTPELDLQKIEETPHLLAILLEIEDVLDSLDVYVYRNWMLGQVVSGPVIKRYWVDIVLRYTDDKMPDPRAGLRLLTHGVIVKFKKDEIDGVDGEKEPVWHIAISVPRKLLNGMNDSSTDFYDDEIDAADVDSAKDQGVDSETGFTKSGGQHAD